MTRPTETDADATALAGSPTVMDSGTAGRWLDSLVRPARGSLRLATLLGVLHGWLLIPQAWLLASLVSSVILPPPEGTEPAPMLAMLAGVMLLRVITGTTRDWLASHAGLIASDRLRTGLFRHLYALGPAGLRSRDSGALSNVALDQSEAVGNYVGRYLPQRTIAILAPLGLLIAVFSQDWLAGMLLLFAAPLIPLFMALVGMGAAGANQRQFQALARLSGQFLDRLQGLDALKHFGRGAATVRELEAGSEDYRRRTMQVLRIAFLSSAVLEFFSSVAIAMLAIYIGLGLLGYFTLGPAPELTLQTGLFILLLAPDFFAPLRDLATHYHDRAAAQGAAGELAPILEEPSPMTPRGERVLTDDAGLTVQARGVRLGYQPGQTVVRDFHLELHPGEAVLLVGPSGSGKTSVLYALMGLLHPQAGAILIDGIPLEELAPDALERRLGWLGQNPHLLPGTLRGNILLGAPDAGAEAVRTAAEQAGVTRFSDTLPGGLETPVGERGVGLSGGEAQRVALARALIRKPALLLLDEPTARLDPDSREIILHALQTLHRNGTTLLIASHQPEQFSWADRQVHLPRTGGQGDSP
ncbi:MAG: thiol reductant ABC exporter subunit CydD [Ectothiorhodospiraceae bacterium]|nr:thiol reductant ABC exporter subunit CydD [Ectothiorhodospiraceae bacterium]